MSAGRNATFSIIIAILGLTTGWNLYSADGTRTEPSIDVAPHCGVPVGLLPTHLPLPLTASRLAEGDPLVIVAIGSSSTAGHGASHAAASYPARLRDELALRFPNSPITVFNKGIGGETAGHMIARFERDVIALKPHLVIWQTGTNSALRNHSSDQFRQQVSEGIRILRQSGPDVIFITPQYAPRFNNLPNRMEFVRAVDDAAMQSGVGLFPRHAIMKYWIESDRFDFKAILSSDGLHLNDLSYDCVAQLLAEQIETIVRPIDFALSTR